MEEEDSELFYSKELCHPHVFDEDDLPDAGRWDCDFSHDSSRPCPCCIMRRCFEADEMLAAQEQERYDEEIEDAIKHGASDPEWVVKFALDDRFLADADRHQILLEASQSRPGDEYVRRLVAIFEERLAHGVPTLGPITLPPPPVGTNPYAMHP